MRRISRNQALLLIGAFACGSLASAFTQRRSVEPLPDKIRGLPVAELKQDYRRPSDIPHPEYNPYSAAKAELGRKLFYDPILSGNNRMACATCHRPDRQFSDGLRLGRGHDGRVLKRRTPTIWNLAWAADFFWDGRARTLEEQALGPITSPDEMNQDPVELVLELQLRPGYDTQFALAFPERGEPVTIEKAAKAIATFERTLVTGRSPFDRWIEGEETALSPLAQKGFAVFNSKADCFLCHKGWNFTDNGFKDTGLKSEDLGMVIGTSPDSRFLFKTPGLRNVAKRGPFMHDGSLTELDDVIEFYDKGGEMRRPSLSEFMKPLHLDKGEKKALRAFLESLTSD